MVLFLFFARKARFFCKNYTTEEHKMEQKITSTIRLRMSSQDAHYGGNLVDGAHMLALFGDVATELLIKCVGVKACSKHMTWSNS